MNDLIEEVKYKGYTIGIYPDDMAENPIEEWDGQGRFYHWKDYGKDQLARYCELLGYDQDTRETIGKEDPDAVRIDKYEHSGISYSVAGEGMNCRWDTSHTWAVWYPDQCLIDKLKGKKGAARRKQCIEYARQACKLFNTWANGGVVGFRVTKNGEDFDSCYGYYEIEDAIKEAKSQINYYAKAEKKLQLQY